MSLDPKWLEGTSGESQCLLSLKVGGPSLLMMSSSPSDTAGRGWATDVQGTADVGHPNSTGAHPKDG